MTTGDWQKIDCGKQRWWVDPDWSEQLLDHNGLRLDEWSQDGKVEVIKNSLHRTVYRVGLETRPVYIKHYPTYDLRSRLLRWVRHAKAWIEWQHTTLLQQHHVPTIKPIAVGQHAQRGSFLVTEEIPDAVPLLDYIEQHWNQRSNCRHVNTLLTELGQFLSQMLNAGIVHDDLHAGNILIHSNPDGQRKWYLIDPYSVHRQAGQDQTLVLKTLSLISQNYWHRLSPRERLRYWHIFHQAIGCQFNRSQERLFIAQLERTIQSRFYANWNQRAARCTKANRDFYQMNVRRCRAWASRDIPADWLADFLYAPDRAWQQEGALLLKKSRHGAVARIPGPTQPVILKMFLPRHWVDRLVGRWRRSPALHCYRMAYRLQTADIPTAKPLAVIEHRQQGQLRSSYCITEYLDHSHCLSTAWTGASRRQRLQILNQLARMIQRLHAFQLSHRDLKAVNIHVRFNGIGGERSEPSLFLIDLRGVKHCSWVTRTRKCKDLARLALSGHYSLHVSRSDMLRFLKQYLPRQEQQRWKWWWRRISLYFHLKVRQNDQRHRDLS